MSLLQAIVACILPGFSALSPESSRRVSPVFEQPAHGIGNFTLSSALRRGPAQLVSPASSSVTRTTASDEHSVELPLTHLDLSALVVKSLELRKRFRAETFPATSFDYPEDWHGNIEVRSQSPKDEAAPRYRLGFARATPPKIIWRSVTASPSQSEEKHNVAPAYSPRSADYSVTAERHTAPSAAETMYISALCQFFSIPRRCYGYFSGAGTNYDATVAYLSDTGAASNRSTMSSFVQSPPNSVRSMTAEYGHVDGTQPEGERHEGEQKTVEEFRAVAAPVVPQHPDGTRYEILGKLGEGSYGRVMAALSSDGEVVALKVIHKPMVYQVEGGREGLYSERDLMVLAALNGMRYLARLKAAWEQEDNVYFAMELCAEDLRTRLGRAARSREVIPERELKLLCAEMILSLVDLQELRIVHGDIKPENFLITKEGRVVLSDLGLAQRAPPDWNGPFDQWPAELAGGTPGYYAPEALCIERGSHTPLTSKADVFSLGLVLAELLCGLHAPIWDTCSGAPEHLDPLEWQGMSDSERQAARMMTEGLRDVLDRDWIENEDARDLVRQMLQPHPWDRPSPFELLRHRYFWDLNVGAVRHGVIPHASRPELLCKLKEDVRSVAFETWRRGSGRFARPSGEEIALMEFTWREPRRSEAPADKWDAQYYAQIT
ncbi:kinase-like protein [Pilatotrama ljubarskyi]|nr:kinase-like protein [Pilatotrama ljubarskyi]